MTKVLIVDDELACRDSLRLLLSFEDYEIRTAADAEQSLEVAEGFLPDVLIVDWMLKDKVDGLQVAEAVRGINPRLRTIVITGFPSADLEARISAFPSAEYLSKPFRPDELIAAAERAAEQCG